MESCWKLLVWLLQRVMFWFQYKSSSFQKIYIYICIYVLGFKEESEFSFPACKFRLKVMDSKGHHLLTCECALCKGLRRIFTLAHGGSRRELLRAEAVKRLREVYLDLLDIEEGASNSLPVAAGRGVPSPTEVPPPPIHSPGSPCPVELSPEKEGEEPEEKEEGRKARGTKVATRDKERRDKHTKDRSRKEKKRSKSRKERASSRSRRKEKKRRSPTPKATPITPEKRESPEDKGEKQGQAIQVKEEEDEKSGADYGEEAPPVTSREDLAEGAEKEEEDTPEEPKLKSVTPVRSRGRRTPSRSRRDRNRSPARERARSSGIHRDRPREPSHPPPAHLRGRRSRSGRRAEPEKPPGHFGHPRPHYWESWYNWGPW